MARLIHNAVNMYRVTGDDWDSWQDLHSHFDVARDFAAAGLIGATGLDGFSWPDLDMLPLGFLTDPGANHGPYRFSRLALEEQRTQMTLWAMAKSPLMFGGDMLMINNTTIDLLTNRIVLEINANSYGNVEVQNLNATAERYIPSLMLVDCQGAKDTSWSLKFSGASEKNVHLCWTHMKIGDGCLHWDSSSTATARTRKRVMQQSQISMSPAGRVAIHQNSKSCLDARVNRFSLCSQGNNQIWHAQPDGKLVSNSSKLCAVVDGLKPNSEAREAIDTRIWMARGRQGEYYVGLFNLEKQPVYVSVPINGLFEAGLHRRQNIVQSKRKGVAWTEYECRGQEVWSMDDIGKVKGVLHTMLAPHGCALFSLFCSLVKEVSTENMGVSTKWSQVN